MEEIIDILNEDGKLSENFTTKKIIHEKGLLHMTVHIAIISKDRKRILLQKRSKDKNLYKNTWDISVGGHVSKGEIPLEALKRELKEEIGLNYIDYDIKQIDTFRECLKDNEVICNELVYLYLMFEDINTEELVLQKEELSKVSWFTKNEFIELINKKEIVPHLKEYKELLNIMI